MYANIIKDAACQPDFSENGKNSAFFIKFPELYTIYPQSH